MYLLNVGQFLQDYMAQHEKMLVFKQIGSYDLLIFNVSLLL
jgi:hypothetical protein